jgi:non-heme chloroperoxidase
MLNKRFLKMALTAITSFALIQVSPVLAQNNQTFATTPDGVKIAIQEYGNPKGSEIVFVHGLLGSHLNWRHQVKSPLLRKYRIITYDMRGHGLSSKPVEARYYREGKRWGDELNTVLVAKHLKRPIVVPWSLGGLVLTNYINSYGTKRLGGVFYVDAVFELAPGLVGDFRKTREALTSSDLASHLEGTRQFVRSCFYRAPDTKTLDLLVANAAVASLDMTQAVHKGITSPARIALPKVAIPAVILYGERDELTTIKMVQLGHRLLPKAQVIGYPNTGHAPFYEQASRFNRDLDSFAKRALK